MEGFNVKYSLALMVVPAMLLAQSTSTPAQFRKVDPQLTHERITTILPKVGAGTLKSPKRPLYSDLEGLTGFTAEISDDGRFSLVEFVAKESKHLVPIANSGQRQERKDSPNKDAILEEFKRYKRNFKPERFGLAVP